MNLLRNPHIKKLVLDRRPQFVITTMMLVGFLIAIFAGFFGTPVGSRNFGIIFVWIAWWAILMMVAVPFLGRGWCSICPIPIPGEWAQRGALLGPNGEKHRFGKVRWPKLFRNIWLQNLSFILVALFSTVILTVPRVTAIVLAAFLFIAFAASLIFERRAFCRYLCPVGGFIGIYSQIAPVEIRVVDNSICVNHIEKTCYTGNQDGYGCPWNVFPPGLIKNNYCGACLECVRTCPYDNIALNIRPFGADLSQPRGRKLDEAYKAFIMAGSAVFYSLVLLGPWNILKNAAFEIGSIAWFLYTLAFLFSILILLPATYLLAVGVGKKISRSTQVLKQLFVSQSYALVPLGLFAWIAFSVSFVFNNLGYIFVVASDPFGWGWNLFGLSTLTWNLGLGQFIPLLQIIALVIGCVWSIKTSKNIALERMDTNQTTLMILPIALFILVFTVGMMWLLL